MLNLAKLFQILNVKHSPIFILLLTLQTPYSVNGVQQETTKTNKARFVDLNDFAFEAFQQLRLLTYLKYEHVFICDETGKEFTTQKSLSEKFVASLKANGIRYRPAYNTRHTYATVCLMNGLNPVYVASQLGHSLVMLMKRYAKWINSDKNKEEIAKISNSAKIVPKKRESNYVFDSL